MSAPAHEAMSVAASPDIVLPSDLESFDGVSPESAETQQNWVRRKLGALATKAKQLLLGDLYTELANERENLSTDCASQSEDITRRKFLELSGHAATLGTGIALGAYGYEAAELGSEIVHAVDKQEDELWPYTEPSFQFLGGERYRGQKQIAIYLPGFGDMHPKEEAELWQETSGVPDLLTGYVDYSNEGTDIPTIVKLIREQIDADQIESVSFVCRSIGGLFVLPIAAELGIPVKSLLLMSSPSKLENGDMGSYGRLLAKLPRWRALATFGKFVANAFHSYTVHGFHPGENFDEGWDSTMSGANPIALQTELRTAASINIQAPSLQQKLRKVLIPGYTRAIYAASYHPETDQTVRVVASGNDFREELTKLGIDCELVGIPYEGHANVSETAGSLQSWTRLATSPNRVLAAAK